MPKPPDGDGKNLKLHNIIMSHSAAVDPKIEQMRPTYIDTVRKQKMRAAYKPPL